MPYSRDPLSVQMDPQAAFAVTMTIAQYEKRRSNTALVPYVRVRVVNPLGVIPVRETGKDRLSPHERAFLRACYYDSRIHQLTSRRKPDARWSLKATWADVPVLPGAARNVTLQVFSDTDGARYADKLPAAAKFSETPELRNTGGL